MTVIAWLQAAKLRGASDLHLTAGSAPTARLRGRLEPLSEEKLRPADLEQLAAEIVPAELRAQLEHSGQADFGFADGQGGRCRANVYRSRGSFSLALRLLPEHVPQPEDIGVPAAVVRLMERPHGLLIVTGPTGSGKTTTLASLVGWVNGQRAVHIVTLEDPIEYVHPSRRSLVHQREIGGDTESFAAGLRAALREDPDVILVGEMRDAETVGIALTAAETGHLVLATLHTVDAPGAVERIVDTFAPHQQPQARAQLAAVLEGVVAQRLLPHRSGQGRVAAFEVLVATAAVRNLVREGKTHQLASTMQTGVASGMQTMEMALRQLVGAGLVEDADARPLIARWGGDA